MGILGLTYAAVFGWTIGHQRCESVQRYCYTDCLYFCKCPKIGHLQGIPLFYSVGAREGCSDWRQDQRCADWPCYGATGRMKRIEIDGHLYKSTFRRYASLLTKIFSVHIKHMRRQNFVFAPSLV